MSIISRRFFWTAVCLSLFMLGCQTQTVKQAESPRASTKVTAFASTYQPIPSTPILIQNATILTGTGEQLDRASL